ncbi:MAG TPA: carboxylating nicotinate-nucleotide diphosphorylase [Polyangiaceae bacterium]
MIPSALLQQAVDRALGEDLHAGDVTSEALLGEDVQCVARALAKQPLVACGSEVFARVFYTVDPTLRVEEFVADGQQVPPGTALYCVEGSARSVLAGERTALNFVQRLAGIATLTRRFVERLPAETKARIVDTRKTTPGLRAFERYAVRSGGARNHRDSLGAGVLIKDNHIAAVGGLTAAIQRARGVAPHSHRIEVEVESLAAVDEALAAGADIIMLDNFEPAELGLAIEKISGRALVEVSGGVTLDRVESLARAGVDVISVGALTHSAAAADISLDLELLGS